MGKSKKDLLAAALKYDSSQDGAPRLVAKGSGFLAKKIIDTAENQGIHIVKNELLSESLQSLPPGSDIPESMYRIVAGILAMVYDLDRRVKNGEG